MKPAFNFHQNQEAAAFAESLADACPIHGSFFPAAVIPLCNRSGSLE